MEFQNIKCIIWDLDNTLWDGILLEDKAVKLNKVEELLQYSTEVGVINSVCSKNDAILAQNKLEEMGVTKYFVFNSINFESKGKRIRKQICDLQLQAKNVLFLDDEVSNLKEAAFYNSGLLVSQPYIIAELTRYYKRIYESGYRKNRIEQYRILENKHNKQQEFSTNEEFLIDSHINVVLHEDWEVEFERIFELCQRTNQLNFTKKRSTAEELRKEFLCAKHAGYVEVYDKYGNYGNVGYFILDANEHLSHFVFSCRVLNMGVEQYVYHLLGKPEVEILYPVASSLNALLPNWINQNAGQKALKKKETTSKILLKGSCDFRRMELYLRSGVEFEVPYVLNEKLLVYQTGIPTMAMTLLFDAGEIAKYAEGVPFYSNNYYMTKLFSTEYDIVFISTISLANLGVYKHKSAEFFLSMGLPEFPIYLPENESKYAPKGIYANGFSNEPETFSRLRENFSYIYDTYVEKYLEIHLRHIIKNIKANQIYFILGNEEKYLVNKTPAGRKFETINKLILTLSEKERFKTINISDYISGSDDVINHFNHYSSRVYYSLANDINKIIEGAERG